jgi:DNA-binding CsgD family transcriptional regulator
VTLSSDPESIDRFVLRWHRAAVTLAPEALPRWLLASLTALVTFSCGLWVLGVGAVGPARAAVSGPPGTRTAEPLRPGDVHAVGLPDEALAAGAGTWLLRQALAAATADDGRATVAALAHDHGPLQARQPLLVLREPDAPADRQQMLVLLRPVDGPAFGVDERRLLERLAPHAMQALTTARTLAEARQAARHGLATASGGGLGAATGRAAGSAPMRPFSHPAGPGWVDAATGGPAGDGRAAPGGWMDSKSFTDATTGEPLVNLLTPIEREVARHYAAGRTDREITAALGLPPGAVREHLRRAFAKLGVASRAQVAAALDGPPVA